MAISKRLWSAVVLAPAAALALLPSSGASALMTNRASCILTSENDLVVTRLYADGVGSDDASDESSEESATRGQRVDHLSAGPLFGKSTATHPNVGFSSRDGSIVNGTPASEQPVHLECSPAGLAVVGWRFSNNVAELRDVIDLDTRTSRLSRTGDRIETHISGRRVATYLDPALTSPVGPSPSDPSRAYFDESFGGGAGREVVTRRVAFGSPTEPNRVVVQRRSGTVTFDLFTDASTPLVETIERHLDGGASLVSRRFHSGTLVARFDDSAVARYTYEDVNFQRGSSGAMSCAPTAGLLTAVITPRQDDVTADGRHAVVTIVRQFRDGEESSAVFCSPATRDCSTYAHAKSLAYGPPACPF